MANETRIRANFIGGVVDDNPLTIGATTLTSSTLNGLPPIGSTEHAVIVLDPAGVGGTPEIVYVTAHTAGASTATITRGMELTTARQHNINVTWVHTAVNSDFDGSNGGSGLLSVMTYANGTDTATFAISSNVMSDISAGALVITFTAPPSGKVLVKAFAPYYSQNGGSDAYLGLREGTTTVASCLAQSNYSGYSASIPFVISGLTPGSSHTYKLAGRSSGSNATIYTGPVYGSVVMEVWAVNV